MRLLRIGLIVPLLLSVVACVTGQRNLRSHPAVFADPHEDFVVLVPIKRLPASAEAGQSPVKVASLTPAVAASADAPESLTKLLNEYRNSDKADSELLARMSRSYGADVAQVRFTCVDVDRDSASLGRLRRGTVLPQDRCTYISADMRDLLAIPPSAVQRPERNDIVAMLLNASDYNCSNFLVRAFAKKTNLDSRRNTLQDIGTGLATLTANPAPALAAGLGLSNLITTSAVDNYNASFYLEKTFQVMESAIGKERATIRARIVDNMKKVDDYSLYAALNDVRSYDDACSIERGISILSEMAAVQRRDAEGTLNGASNPELEKVRQLQALSDKLDTTIRQNASDRTLVDALTKQRDALEQELRKAQQQQQAPPANPAPQPNQ